MTGVQLSAVELLYRTWEMNSTKGTKGTWVLDNLRQMLQGRCNPALMSSLTRSRFRSKLTLSEMPMGPRLPIST